MEILKRKKRNEVIDTFIFQEKLHIAFVSFVKSSNVVTEIVVQMQWYKSLLCIIFCFDSFSDQMVKRWLKKSSQQQVHWITSASLSSVGIEINNFLSLALLYLLFFLFKHIIVLCLWHSKPISMVSELIY